MSNSGKIDNCQICDHSPLQALAHLGSLPPVNAMADIHDNFAEQRNYPLELVRCEQCSLVQLNYIVPQDILFPESYPYLSGTTRILRDNFKQLAVETKSYLKLQDGDLVVDIGSNDGTLLAPFKEQGNKVLGVEPSQAADVAQKAGIDTYKNYFNKQSAQYVVENYGNAKLVTAANVFAHIEDVHSIVEGIKVICGDDGVFVNESHYLLSLLQTVQYDTVYHEHLRYYSLLSLQQLFAMHDLEIFNAKLIPTHGGSIRVYAGKKGQHPIDPAVDSLIAKELEYGLDTSACYIEFFEKVKQSKYELLNILSQIKLNNERVYAVGAPSRASTLFSFVGLDHTLIDCVLELPNSHKINKYMPGTIIPVLDEAKLYQDQPEYALFGSWHIADELMLLIAKKGFKGKFIVPLPQPKVYSAVDILEKGLKSIIQF